MHTDMTVLMSLVLDGEATPVETVQLERHIAGCHECAEVWRNWQALDARLAAAPSVLAPPGLVGEVMERLDRHGIERRRRQWLLSGVLAVWAGVFCAVWMAALLAVWWAINHPTEVSLVAASGAQALSTFSLFLGSIDVFFDSLDARSVSLGLVGLLSLTAGVTFIWFWAFARSTGWQLIEVSATRRQQAR